MSLLEKYRSIVSQLAPLAGTSVMLLLGTTSPISAREQPSDVAERLDAVRAVVSDIAADTGQVVADSGSSEWPNWTNTGGTFKNK